MRLKENVRFASPQELEPPLGNHLLDFPIGPPNKTEKHAQSARQALVSVM